MSSKPNKLLAKFKCPMPYHRVRTLFMGAIASPRHVSPIETVQSIWGGHLPEAKSLEDLNDLLAFLMNDVWNGLTKHQELSDPFQLVLVPVKPARKQLQKLAITRLEELDGFIEGLFGTQHELRLPKRADQALDELVELRQLFQGAEELLGNSSKNTNRDELTSLLDNLKEISRIAEIEMNAAIVDCVRFRQSKGEPK